MDSNGSKVKSKHQINLEFLNLLPQASMLQFPGESSLTNLRDGLTKLIVQPRQCSAAPRVSIAGLRIGRQEAIDPRAHLGLRGAHQGDIEVPQAVPCRLRGQRGGQLRRLLPLVLNEVRERYKGRNTNDISTGRAVTSPNETYLQL